MNTVAEAPFSRGEALRFAWATTWRHIGLIGGVVLAGLLVSLLQGGLLDLASGPFPALRTLITVATQLLELAVSMGLIQIALRLHDGRATGIGDIVPSLSRFLDFVFGAVLYGLIVFAGLILLVVPGIYWAIKYGFTKLIIVDQGLDPLSALRRSAELTRGARGSLFVFGLLLLGVNLLGLLALGVGLLVTVPMTVLALVHVYRRLLQRGRVGADVLTAPVEPMGPHPTP